MRKLLFIFAIFILSVCCSAQTTYNFYTGFEAGTNGAAPTTGTLGSGSHGDTGGLSNWNITSMGAGLLYATAGQLSNYPSNISVSSTNYDGSGSLGLQCTTTTGGQGNCGIVSRQFSVDNATVADEAFYVKWSCPASVADCGAMGGMATYPSGKFSVIHVLSSAGVQSMYLETSSQVLSSPITVSPNTTYLINMQMNGGGAGTDYLTVCNAAGTSVIGSISNTNGITDANYPSYLHIGITGEEPTTAGYTYEWDDFAFDTTGANFSISFSNTEI